VLAGAGSPALDPGAGCPSWIAGKFTVPLPLDDAAAGGAVTACWAAAAAAWRRSRSACKSAFTCVCWSI
jgi:hypothetical protein